MTASLAIALLLTSCDVARPVPGVVTSKKLEATKLADIKQAPGIHTDLVADTPARLLLTQGLGEQELISANMLNQIPSNLPPITAFRRAVDTVVADGWKPESATCFGDIISVDLAGSVASTWPGEASWPASATLMLDQGSGHSVGPVQEPYIEFSIYVPVGPTPAPNPGRRRPRRSPAAAPKG